MTTETDWMSPLADCKAHLLHHKRHRSPKISLSAADLPTILDMLLDALP